MDDEHKKTSGQESRSSEINQPGDSLPISIDDLRDLLSFLHRENAPECDHTLRETLQFLKLRNLDVKKIVSWLNKMGGNCDCEVLFNVYDEVGDLVGWHLDI